MNKLDAFKATSRFATSEKIKFFGGQGIFFKNFYSRNGCKNEFKDNNEKSCSWSRKSFSHKIDFEALWPRNGHAASVGVNLNKKCEKIIRPLRIRKNNQNTADRLNRKKKQKFLSPPRNLLENFLASFCQSLRSKSN